MIGRMFLNLDNWTQNTRVKAGRQAKTLFQFFCQEKMVTWTKVVSMAVEGSGWICKFFDLKFLLILNRMFLITFTSDGCYKGKMRHHIHAPSRGPTHVNAFSFSVLKHWQNRSFPKEAFNKYLLFNHISHGPKYATSKSGTWRKILVLNVTCIIFFWRQMPRRH